ncbi:hypothetical protein BGZ58_010329 [Dissophora ornata]|nr:hypothetical protein BGZ58_010329 [Dissophora ornata]
MDKKKAHHNKKVLRAAASNDSLESDSIAPQPHLPSSVYSPNPFPLDPTQPGGVSRFNAFHAHRERQTREVETIDIEVEETKGFVSGKSRRSIDGGRLDRALDDDMEYELAAKPNPIQKLGAGLKGALAKSGLSKNRDKETENEHKEVDAVLQHQMQQQREQQQRLRETDVVPKPARGREREKQRPMSGPLYSDRMNTGDGLISPSSITMDQRDPYLDRRRRPQSLSPSPPLGQDRRNSATYWPEGHRAIHSEQARPFIEYQPPPPVSSTRRYEQRQQQQRQTRPRSLTSDSDYGDVARHGRDVRYSSRERRESDRMRREVLSGGVGGARRHSGLNHVTSADSVARTSSEFGDDEDTSSPGAVANRQTRQQTPDRLGRAKEWIAKNNSVAAPAPVVDREAALSSIPGSFPSRPSRRLSMDSEEYGLMTPPRGSYLSSAGGGHESRERMVMMNQMNMQDIQRNRRESVDDDGRYWSRQLEGYEHDRYRQTRMEYEYDSHGNFYGQVPETTDDVDDDEEAESTLAPGSAVGGADAAKKKGGEVGPPAMTYTNEEENQMASPKVPNKRRLVLRLISLSSSVLVLILLVAAAPVSHSSSPFSSQMGLAFHYVVAILSVLVSFAFVFNYFSRRLRRQEKMKRYILFGLDILMTLAWLIDVFVCISKFPCAVGGQHGWCDMYNSSVFLGIIAFLSFLAAFLWDIWGSFDHSKWFGDRPFIKPPPPGYDKRAMGAQGAGPGWSGGRAPGGMGRSGGPGAWPGQMPGQAPGQAPWQGAPGQGYPKKPKNSKALW